MCVASLHVVLSTHAGHILTRPVRNLCGWKASTLASRFPRYPTAHPLPDHRQWLSTAHGWSRPVVTRSTLIDARSFRLGVPSPFLPDGHQKLEMPSPCCSLPSIPGDAILHWVCASLLHSTVLPQITDSLLHHVCHGHAVVDNAEYGFLGSLGLPFTYVMP